MRYLNRIFYLLVFMCLFISGCVGGSEEKFTLLERKIEDINSTLEFLANKAESVDQRLNTIEENYNKLTKPKSGVSGALPINNMTNIDIQTALKKAGFYNGPTDGRMGPDTSEAIKTFQKANGLKADGIAGTKTKTLLIRYLTP